MGMSLSLGLGITSLNKGGRGPWTPLRLAGAFRLFDPTDALTLTMASTKVAEISEKNGQHSAAQATDAARPTVADGLLVFGSTTSLVQYGGRGQNIPVVLQATQTMPDATPAVAGKGFTNTGLSRASYNRYWSGNHGKTSLASPSFDASAVLLDASLNVVAQIKLSDFALTQGSVQGVVEAPDGTLWVGVCQIGSPYIAHFQINYDGSGNYVDASHLGSLTVGADPNGLAYDTSEDALIYCPQGTNVTATWVDPSDGSTIKTKTLPGTDIDHLFYDQRDGTLWFTKDQSFVVVRYDIDAAAVIEGYNAAEALSVEGIVVGDNTFYLNDDGYFHETAPDLNVLMTFVANTKPRKKLGTKFALYGVAQCPTSLGSTRSLLSVGQPISASIPGVGVFVASGSLTTLRVIANNRTANFTVPSMATAFSYIVRVDLDAGTVELVHNGASLGTQSLTGTASNPSIDRYFPMIIDGYENGTSVVSFNGNIGVSGDIVGEMTSDEIDKLAGYLAWKYQALIPGLVTALPSDHPYKTVAP